MVKLFYSTTYCGSASFIAALAASVNMECEEVDLSSHQTASGSDFYTINSTGTVPTLVFDDGTILTEAAAVLQWIADQNPGTIAPEYGTMERYLTMNALSFLASEVHANIRPLFGPMGEEQKSAQMEKLNKKIAYMQNTVLKEQQFLVGNQFSIADIYFYIVLGKTVNMGVVDIDAYPALKAYFERIEELQMVKDAKAKMQSNPATI